MNDNLNLNYDPKRMTWNEDDRTFFEEKIDTVYSKVAEVVITQNERFFRELEKQTKRIDCNCDDIANHEMRIRKLEKDALKRKLGRAAIVIVIIGISLLSLSFII